MFDTDLFFWDYITEENLRERMDEMQCLTVREAHDYLDNKLKATRTARRPLLTSRHLMYAAFKFQVSLERHLGKVRFENSFYICGWRYDSESKLITKVESFIAPPTEANEIND
jgi:hypothetical protein